MVLPSAVAPRERRKLVQAWQGWVCQLRTKSSRAAVRILFMMCMLMICWFVYVGRGAESGREPGALDFAKIHFFSEKWIGVLLFREKIVSLQPQFNMVVFHK